MLNFSLKELTHSDIAKQNNIDNTPNIEQCDNLLNLIFYCLQPIRDKLKRPMIITSGFRCPKVNFFAGGAINSGHLNGTCADFVVKGMPVEQAYQFIKKSGIKYTQLIQEKGKWVHIQYDSSNLKNENLKFDGKKYIKD